MTSNGLVSLWGYSSVGRALAWHARGQQFDSAYLHQRSAVEIEEVKEELKKEEVC
jgi:hypothetical protein